MKYRYFIMINLGKSKYKFVTDYDPSTKYAKWEDEKYAMPFNKEMADNIIYGLRINNTPAYLVRADKDVEIQNFND